VKDKESEKSAKKIGIMTFHWTHNYGAVLQAYALYRYIKEMYGCDVSLVDFRTKRQDRLCKTFRKLSLNKNIHKSLAIYALQAWNYRSLKRKKDRFSNFLENFFSQTRHYSDIQELQSVPPELDAVVTGSDQVFNPAILPEQELLAYCLQPFEPSKTRLIAYAPSFGNASISNTDRELMTTPLTKLEHLSAREEDGVLLLQKMTGKNVSLVLDPVFLLDKEQWQEIAQPSTGITGNYILCYSLNGREKLDAVVTRVKQETGLPVVLVTSNVHSRISADKVVLDAGPEEFIWLIDNAKIVVTDSFHGTAFSTIFEKNFFVQIAWPESSQRLTGFLKNAGLSERIVDEADAIITESMNIDYSQCNLAISEAKKLSRRYLSSSLIW